MYYFLLVIWGPVLLLWERSSHNYRVQFFQKALRWFTALCFSDLVEFSNYTVRLWTFQIEFYNNCIPYIHITVVHSNWSCFHYIYSTVLLSNCVELLWNIFVRIGNITVWINKEISTRYYLCSFLGEKPVVRDVTWKCATMLHDTTRFNCHTISGHAITICLSQFK